MVVFTMLMTVMMALITVIETWNSVSDEENVQRAGNGTEKSSFHIAVNDFEMTSHYLLCKFNVLYERYLLFTIREYI